MIRIICVGQVKEKFYREAICEYKKRMHKYHKLVIEEVMDSDIEAEGKLILKKIKDKDYVISLEIEGEMLNSMEFSEMIDKCFLSKGTITFVIGGSDGLAEDVKRRADFHLSFSNLTFPHQLFRVILLEQIYRAFKIMNNETYHK